MTSSLVTLLYLWISELMLWFPLPSHSHDEIDVTFEDSLMILLSNISEGYYSFLMSRERSGNFLAEATNEPINYPSNVENGLGYFNTHYPSLRFFDLKALKD